MKLSIQTIKSGLTEIDVPPDSTVDQFRDQIRQIYNWPKGSKIILVHKTKILSQQTSKLSEIPNIKEGDRIVVMKKNEPVKPAPAAAPEVPPPAAATVPQVQSEAQIPGAQTEVNATPSQPMQMFYNDSQIEQLGNMGFDSALARRALTAAFGNTDRAVEYLISGNIPNVAEPRSAPNGGAAPQAIGQPASGDAMVQPALINNTEGLQTEAFGRATNPPAANAGGEQGPNALMSQFSQLAASDPNFLSQMLRAIGEQNPGLLSLIEQNPRMFAQLLTSLASGEGPDGDGAQSANPPGAVTVQLTQAEVEAVNRLCELGFSKEAALQAYLACDKNEELAANFLFDNIDIDE